MQLAASVVRPDAANYFIEVFYRISFSSVTAFRFPDYTQKKISFRKKIFFLPQGNKFSCGRKSRRLPKKKFPSFERKFSAVRKEKNFCAQGNKFPHMRKYFFVYTEINFLIYGNFTPCKPAGNAGREKEALLPYSTNETSPLSSSELSGDA